MKKELNKLMVTFLSGTLLLCSGCGTSGSSQISPEQAEEALQEQLQIANDNAEELRRFFTGTDGYMPNGYEEWMVYSNIAEEYEQPELTAILSETFDGYWTVFARVNFEGDASHRNVVNVYWAQDLDTELVGYSKSNSSETADTVTEGGIRALNYDNDADLKLIPAQEWEEQFGEEWQEKHMNALQNKRFSGFYANRRLENLNWSEFGDEYTRPSESMLSIQSISAEIEDGDLVISLKVKSNIDAGWNWSVVVGYYNAAGERKGGFDCDMEWIAGQASSEGVFRGVPNCVDELMYYRVEGIRNSG